MKHLIALTAVVAASVATAAALAGEKAYTDGAGDAGTAPDLTSVTVSDTNGFLAFKIMGNLAPSTSYVIWIDTDRNQSTGDEGDELRVGIDQEADAKSYWFASKWTGSTWERAGVDVTSRTFDGREELGFRAADAGITGPFNFVVGSMKFVADAVESRDLAPDSVVPFTYELTAQRETTAAKATIGTVRLLPARPVAGKPLTLRFSVTSSATGQPLTTGVATCSAQVKGRVVRGSASISNGIATCKLVVPKRTAGTVGRGSITIGSGAVAVTKPFSFRIA
jgi:hypothetical protein